MFFLSPDSLNPDEKFGKIEATQRRGQRGYPAGAAAKGESGMTEKPEKKHLQPPHPFVMIFAAMLCAALLTHLVPLGRYELKEVTYVVNGEQRTGTAVDPSSFRYSMDEKNQRVVYPAPVFGVSARGESGMMNYLFDGLNNSRQAAATAGLAAYMLVIGGSFGVLMRTGVADRVILRMVRRIGGSALFVPPALFVLFSLAGAVFGFSEGAIPCAMLVIPLLIAMDFDAITGVMCTFAATQVGVACAWMGIGALESAQTIAGIPVLSGARLRMVLWAVLTALGAGYTAAYASKVYEDPHRSLTHAGDARFRGRFESLRARREPFTLGAKLVAAAVLLSLGWMVWGVMTLNYTLDEIASLFFVMALITGLLGAAFHLDGMQLRDIPRAFQSGASDLVGAVLVMGMAQGMVLLMGGINPTSPSVLNTLLHWAERAFSELPGLLAAWLMYVFQYGVNVVVPSEVGQAALTMPVMAPLADGLGISRQVAVLAFQLGGSLSHLLVPTSGCLIGVLSIARVEWGDWLRSQWKAIAIVFVLASATTAAACIGYT